MTDNFGQIVALLRLQHGPRLLQYVEGRDSATEDLCAKLCSYAEIDIVIGTLAYGLQCWSVNTPTNDILLKPLEELLK